MSYFAFPIGDDPTVILGFGASNVALGICLGLALLCIGVGMIQWARKLMSDHEIVEYRHPGSSSDEDREETVAILPDRRRGVGHRPSSADPQLPASARWAPWACWRSSRCATSARCPATSSTTRSGRRACASSRTSTASPIRPADMEIGQLVNAEPAVFFEEEDGEPVYEGVELQTQKAKAAVIIVKMQPDDITPWPGRENWGVDGILCFSKICTHVGCPISLWEQQTHHLLCPCHQSTFDLADNGKVIFGPAARHLPQLPLAVDDEGYLIATSDFTEAVGPSFWERDTIETGE